MKEINSTEIARLAGVSRSTVSRVINNYPNVPDKEGNGNSKIIVTCNLSAKDLAGKKTGDNRVVYDREGADF